MGLDAAKNAPGHRCGLAVDVIGLIVAVVVVAASVYDNAIGTALLDKVAPAGTVRTALVDQGFKASAVEYGRTLGIDVQIVARNPAAAGFVPEPIRWRVEQTNGLNMLDRRLARDYEHAPSSAESRIYWACAGRILRRLADSPTRRLARRLAGDLMTHAVTQQLLDGIELRERQLTEQVGELAARLREAEAAREALATTAETVRAVAADLELEQPPVPVFPDGAAYQQIMSVFGDGRRPLRARDLCLALDLPVLPKHVEGTRAKLKRLVSLGFLDETEPGLFAQPRPQILAALADQGS